ncbi:hypothetical protein EUTSA_v10026758mg [Eutrema salsugineum]|uniref:Bifunctional inhibitor/plant lipid transfer protein/seed storage helical domain-containing protein n=1 Tax=Eutrema salsugineum TaxID=72664 RepID=V4LY59_EUTSA|nr:hypothetical protein EUTSA_v10026758mg [Eutrema salsugineum]
MEKTSLIFIGLLLLFTYTQVLAQQSCKTVSDCTKMKCEILECVENKCGCANERRVGLPLTKDMRQACIDYCKLIGEVVNTWSEDLCYCRKPPM